MDKAGNCPEVSLKISSSVTLTNVETPCQTVVTLPHIPHPPPPQPFWYERQAINVNIWYDTWPMTNTHLNWNCNWTGIKSNRNIPNADKSPIFLQATQRTTWSRLSSQKWAVATMMVKSQIHFYLFVLRSNSFSASLKDPKRSKKPKPGWVAPSSSRILTKSTAAFWTWWLFPRGGRSQSGCTSGSFSKTHRHMDRFLEHPQKKNCACLHSNRHLNGDTCTMKKLLPKLRDTSKTVEDRQLRPTCSGALTVTQRVIYTVLCHWTVWYSARGPIWGRWVLTMALVAAWHLSVPVLTHGTEVRLLPAEPSDRERYMAGSL